MPVHNGVDHLAGVVNSLDRQSIGSDYFEAVFVDDGSTDDSRRCLDSVARPHANIRVTTIPNSGWPGKPRNVGIDMARGRYVFFMDQDDQLFPDALRDLVAMAERNQSDMVNGKIVRVGRGTPGWAMAGRDIEKAELTSDPVAAVRTVHRLFRTAFLHEHAIRFPEGRVRLEDHHFLHQVLGCSPRASILASTPCYRWIHHGDGSNSSGRSISVEKYWDYYAAPLRVQRERISDPAVWDAGAVAAFQQLFTRPQVAKIAQAPPARQERIFAAVAALVRTDFPARLDHRVGLVRRVQLQALRAEDLDAFLHLDELRRRWGFRLATRHVSMGTAGEFRLTLAPRVLFDDRALAFQDDHLEVPYPYRDLDPDTYDSGVYPVDLYTVELTGQARTSSVEWPFGRVEGGTVAVDPGTAALGRPLAADKWDLHARFATCGLAPRRRVPAPDAAQLPLSLGNGATAYRTVKGNLTFDVTA